MFLQRRDLGAPSRGGFDGFGLTFRRVVQVTHPIIWERRYPRSLGMLRTFGTVLRRKDREGSDIRLYESNKGGNKYTYSYIKNHQ